MTNRMFRLMSITAALSTPAYSYGHGTPIQVEQANGELAVSGGLVDVTGFAPMIFVEDDEDGEQFGATNLPGFGPATLWQIPGYDISGLQENSGLYIEPLARPVKGADPIEHRVLWYWNPESGRVEDTPSTISLQIRKTTSLNTTLLASSETVPPSLQLAAPVADDMGFHNHLVLYAINNPAPIGAYGFFARLTSNLYAPSAPFLLVINNGIIDYGRMTPAALAINAAAFLPGDFNHDDIVNAADYTVWRNGLGSAFSDEDYRVWKNHFGQIEGSAATSSMAVPEPSHLVLLAPMIGGILIQQRRNSRRLELVY